MGSIEQDWSWSTLALYTAIIYGFSLPFLSTFACGCGYLADNAEQFKHWKLSPRNHINTPARKPYRASQSLGFLRLHDMNVGACFDSVTSGNLLRKNRLKILGLIRFKRALEHWCYSRRTRCTNNYCLQQQLCIGPLYFQLLWTILGSRG